MNGIFNRPVLFGGLALVVLFLLMSTIAIVPETKQAVILRFEQPVRTINQWQSGEQFGRTTGAGIIARWPLMERIVWVDKRVLDIELENQPVLSTDQLRLEVDAFARFRVVDPLRMVVTAGSESRVAAQLEPLFGSALRAELGKRPFAALLSPERTAVMDNIQAGLQRYASQYGVQIVDVRIKHADLPDGSPLQSALNRMATAGGDDDPRQWAEGRADHPRRSRRPRGGNLCAKLQQGRAILRFLARDAVLSHHLPRQWPRCDGRNLDHPVARQRLSARVQGQGSIGSSESNRTPTAVGSFIFNRRSAILGE